MGVDSALFKQIEDVVILKVFVDVVFEACSLFSYIQM